MPVTSLHPPQSQYSLLPIQNSNVWSFYKQHVASFWVAEEIDLSRDRDDWKHLTDKEQLFLKHVLAFFAVADAIVSENLALRFIQDTDIAEVKCFYAFQMAMENVHAETYGRLIEACIEDPQERESLFSAMETMESVRRKASWAARWIENADDYGTRLVAFAAVEGIFFSASFCAIFWLKKRGIMPGVCFSNELIARDEGLHRDFACYMVTQLVDPPDHERVRAIVREAVDIESLFVHEALPTGLLGMNADLMWQYVQFVADHLLQSMGYPSEYKVSNPFQWMTLISLDGRTNFFERRVSEYARAGVRDVALQPASFSTDCEF